jgi:Cof subfamily protein (haloacid dehalogenase superfamily)
MEQDIADDLMRHLKLIDLIAVDIDGTLLDSQGLLSDGARATIDSARANGILVALVTGRNYGGLSHIMDLIGTKLPCVCSGGAYIANPETGEVIQQTPVPHKTIERVVALARKVDAAIFIEAHGHIYAETEPHVVDAIGPLASVEVVLTDDILQGFEGDPQKIVMIKDPETLATLEAKIRQNVDEVYLSYSSPIYLEVTKQGANKGNALRQLARHLRISLSHVAAIGDEKNDLSMFEVAGLAIAMGNAAVEIQAAADMIAPSNDEGGVAWTINQILQAHATSTT